MVIEMLHSYKKPSGDSFNTEKSPQTISKHLKNIPYKQKNKALTFKMQGLCTYIHKHIQCKMWALFHRSSIVYGWIMDRLLKCISLNGLTFSQSHSPGLKLRSVFLFQFTLISYLFKRGMFLCICLKLYVYMYFSKNYLIKA